MKKLFSIMILTCILSNTCIYSMMDNIDKIEKKNTKKEEIIQISTTEEVVLDQDDYGSVETTPQAQLRREIKKEKKECACIRRCREFMEDAKQCCLYAIYLPCGLLGVLGLYLAYGN